MTTERGGARAVAVRRRSSAPLDQPTDRGVSLRPSYDTEAFGRVSERIARYIGSWKFIAWMTAVIVAWVAWNVFAPEDLRPDPFPFIFLTLLLSLQASYAAPLILLAQNRQADRDRVEFLADRDRAERMMADTEYLAREIAALRVSIGELATRDYVRGELRELLDELEGRITAPMPQDGGTAPRGTGHAAEGPRRPPRPSKGVGP